jgi:predicted O-methyltransferase YrrM
MTVTDDIRARTGLHVEPEFFTQPPGYSMFNTSGVEVEVGEFLWALVRLTKPERILETGTSYGISDAYMSLALKENGKGKLVTLDATPAYQAEAKKTWDMLGTTEYIEIVSSDSRDYDAKGQTFDMLFLDTEPPYRFSEWVRFWPNLRPGGLVVIHDLFANMSQSGQVVQIKVHGDDPFTEMRDWPFGTLPDPVKALMANGELQSFHFDTPRGLYVGQKYSSTFYTSSVLKREPWTPWHPTAETRPHR